MNTKTVYLIGSASGVAAADAGCKDGPLVLQASPYLAALTARIPLQWHAMLQPEPRETVKATVVEHCRRLAVATAEIVRKKEFFVVFGGDHSCAIGTWSGVCSAISPKGPLGLIWIDAHMDSHTPETTLTGNIHGMPLACLLGYGDPALTDICDTSPKFQPEHVCLIGIRSYEAEEAVLLQRLNVRIFYMEEIERRGLDAVMAEAMAIVNKGTVGYGLTIDIDSVDPIDAPGTGVSESGGLSGQDLCRAVQRVVDDERLIGAEIVEFDPHLDKDQLTEKLAVQLLASILVRD